MERHVFMVRNGDSFWAWNVEFRGREERRGTFPRLVRGPEGVERRGTFSYTVESAHVSFCATHGTIHVGQWGQLSWAGGRSYIVKVAYIELAEGHVIVSGDATGFFEDEGERYELGSGMSKQTEAAGPVYTCNWAKPSIT